MRLREAGIESARLDALLLLEFVTGHDRSHLLAHDDEPLNSGHVQALEKLLKKRVSRVPLAYLTHEREFYGLKFYVDEHVLIPRPETEDIVNYISVQAGPNASILELGTGSGAIAVSLAHLQPKLEITATDISGEALQVARRNALELDIKNVTFMLSDLFEHVPVAQYDYVVANLPYVPEPERRQPEIEYEPDIALYSGEDGLDCYRQFFSQLEQYTHAKTELVLEFSPTQHQAMEQIAVQLGWRMKPLSAYIYAFER